MIESPFNRALCSLMMTVKLNLIVIVKSCWKTHYCWIVCFQWSNYWFCTLPESVVELHVDPELAKKCYLSSVHYSTNTGEAGWWCCYVLAWYGSVSVWLHLIVLTTILITIAAKKDENGKLTAIRVCLDTRMVNAAILEKFDLVSSYPLFVMHWTCLVVTVAYLVSLICQKRISNTRFIQFSCGNCFHLAWPEYMFVGCPFGLAPMPSVFQRGIMRVVFDLGFCGSLYW